MYNGIMCRILNIFLYCLVIWYIAHYDLLGPIAVHAEQLYTYFTKFLSENIKWLMGWPAGLKLNHALNALLGNMSLSGVAWWLDVLQYIVNVVKENSIFQHIRESNKIELVLLVTVSLFGGLSTFLALVMDMLSVLMAHLHLFFLVSKKLFMFVVQAILSCWRLFRGNSNNALKVI